MKFFVFFMGICCSLSVYSNEMFSPSDENYFIKDNKMYVSATYKLKLTPQYTNYSMLISEKFSNNIMDIKVEQYEGDNEVKSKKLIPSNSGFKHYLSHLCKNNIKLSVVLDNGKDAFVGKCTNDNPLTLDSGYVFSDLNSLVLILPDNTNISSSSFSKGIFTIGIDSVSEPVETIWKLTAPVSIEYSIENSINIKDEENFTLEHHLYLENDEFDFLFNEMLVNKNEKVIIEKEKIVPNFQYSSSFSLSLTNKALAFFANHKFYLSNHDKYKSIKKDNNTVDSYYFDTDDNISHVNVEKTIELSYKDSLKEDLNENTLNKINEIHDKLGYFDKKGFIVNKTLISLTNKIHQNVNLQFEVKNDDNILLYSEYSKEFLLPTEKYSFNIYTISSKFNN